MKFEYRTLLLTITLIVLTTISTYDAIAIDGLVPLLQKNFALNNSQTALMKTVSSTATTIVLVLMAVAGDRVGRRLLLLSTGFAWTLALGTSLLSSEGLYWLFIIARAVVSSGTAIFTVLVPVVLADLYRDIGLGRAIMVNMLMELVGNIVAVSLSSLIVSEKFAWWLAFAPIAVISAIATLSLLFTLPKELGFSTYEKRNLFDALKLFRVKSYIFLTASVFATGWYTKVTFFWSPSLVLFAWSYAPDVFFGLPYPAIMTANSASELVGSMLGLPLWLWIAESWQYGRRCFGCMGMFSRALPVVASVNSLSLALSSIMMILMLDISYIAVFIAAFLAGFMGFSAISLTTQMTLFVSDARRRASALSLQRLLSNLIAIPAPQIIGALADAFKGNSELDVDRFTSYQKALAINWISILLSFIFMLAATYFYAADAQNVRGPLRAKSETDPLLARRQSRTASVLEQSLMGRRATMESVRR